MTRCRATATPTPPWATPNFFYNQGNQTLAQDQQIFIQYATATQENKVDLSEYLRTSLMRPELVEAVDWWIDDEDAVTPFDEDETNPYVIAEFAEAEAKQKEAEKLYDEGAEADEVGDQFELSTVLFALTLFFGGGRHALPAPLGVARAVGDGHRGAGHRQRRSVRRRLRRHE